MKYDSYNRWVKRLNSYETCDRCNVDKCPEGNCYYAVLHLESNKNLYFTCGRPVNIGQTQLNSISSNSSLVEKKNFDEMR